MQLELLFHMSEENIFGVEVPHLQVMVEGRVPGINRLAIVM